jgi:hypothetical protein
MSNAYKTNLEGTDHLEDVGGGKDNNKMDLKNESVCWMQLAQLAVCFERYNKLSFSNVGTFLTS